MQETMELKQRIQELMSLLEAFKQLNSNIEIEDVFQDILLQMVNVLGAEAGTLWVLDNGREVIQAVAAHGKSASKVLHFEMAKGEGIVGQVVASGVEQLIGDASVHPQWANRVDSTSGFVTKSMITVPLAAKGHVLGALQLLNKTGGGLFSGQDMRIALALASQSALALHNSQMFDEVSRMLLSMIRTLAKILDARDPYTAGHSERVAQYSLAIAQRTGMDGHECEELYRAALLHDIGKIGIADDVLRKPAKLTRKEYEDIKLHTVIGAGILSNMEPKAAMANAIATARSHHERLDGSGYPDALKGEDIPLFARIVGIADAFDAMTTARSYSKGLPLREAAAELIRCKDTLFDAALVNAFIEVLEESDYQVGKGFGEITMGYGL
ncbi:HD-GYP domain-containing protein (c-di-GMP phosphodiesterase class II) [Planomicrobium koreense]|uniref:HD-GYP domain-containing protein (C-di-GMP phosphodiesterase class II) n=1 Tax=Planococcus koreensis TaxID=112331 RepID=A0A7W8FRB3_9BACL|nr:HD domain-containing phosphohydrolase [Planococcus koreensis]MBB5179334.1 HD-GYP domain-containing protein (c-di-GMP phosphodiesterase class II) [Planococcus koreensis]